MAKTPRKAPIRRQPPATLPRKGSDTKWYIAAIACLTVAVWIGYHDILEHSFHFDDTHAIVNNPSIQDFDTFRSVSYWLNPNNRALPYFTYALNYRVGKLDTTPYHITNIVIHIVSSVLLFFLVIRIFGTQSMKKHRLQSFSIPVALFTALFFALHPVQTQTVTYIVQRMTALFVLFCFAALLSYIHARELHARGRKISAYLPFYLLSVLSAAVAIMSKQTAGTLPIAIVAAEYLFITGKDGKPFRKYLFIWVSVLLVLVGIVLVAGLIPPESGALPPVAYFATQMKVILKYIQLSILPLHLSIDYAFPVSHSLFEPMVLVSGMVHVVLIAIAFAIHRNHPLTAFGIFLFYTPLAITSSIFPIRDVIFEHRIYLSLAGFGLIMATTFFDFYHTRKVRWLYLLPLVYLCLLTYGTHDRNKDWKDACTLWQDALDKTGGTTRSWLAVGDCQKNQGAYDTALEYYNRSLELDSNNATTLNNRGNLRLKLQDVDGAIADYTHILRVSKEFRNLAWLNRGMAFIKRGDYLRAIDDFTNNINSGEAEATVWFHRGITWIYIGDYEAAEADLKVVVEREPANQDALFNLASSMMNMDRLGDAIVYYSRLLTLNPGHVKALHYRGLAFDYLDQRNEACKDWQQAANLNYQPSAELLQKYCRQVNL